MRHERLTDAEFYAKLAEVPSLDTSEVSARLAQGPLGWSGISVAGPFPTVTIGDHPVSPGETVPKRWVDIPDAVIVATTADATNEADDGPPVDQSSSS